MSVAPFDFLTTDFAVDFYKNLERYLLATRSTTVPLELLPHIYESSTRKPFPFPISVLPTTNFLDHLIKIESPAAGVYFVQLVKIADVSPKGIEDIHQAKLNSLIEAVTQPLVHIPDPEIAKNIQLLMRGVHKLLELSPIQHKNPIEIEAEIHAKYFDLWKVPLIFEPDRWGFESLLDLMKNFPGIFQFAENVPLPVKNPNFQVGDVKYTTQSTADGSSVKNSASSESTTPKGVIYTPEQTKMIDQARSAIALIKVEMMECSKDPEKSGKLYSRLAIKQKQLEDLQRSIASQY
jgi:hypothetical protein